MGDGPGESGDLDTSDDGPTSVSSDATGSPDATGTGSAGATATGSADADSLRAVGRATVHGGLVILGAFLVAALFVRATVEILGSFGIAVAERPPAVTAVLTASQFVGFLVVGYWYTVRVGDRELLHLGRPTLRHAGWVVVGLVGLYVSFFALSSLLGALDIQPATNRVIAENRDQPLALLYLAAVSILFVAPGEELLFRGVLQGLFRRALGVVPAVAVASLAFGLVHVVALVGVPETAPTMAEIGAYVAIAGLLGAVLGALYERTETLVVPVAVHGLWNAYQFVAVYATETGVLVASP